MSPPNTYTHSQLAAASVADLVAAQYRLRAPIDCRFYVSGLHDNYLVQVAGRKSMLRLYRADWRSPEEVQFELELLWFLKERDAPVAGPVRTGSGELSFAIECPEGRRLAALFDYAEGRAPEGGEFPVEECTRLGHVVAKVHAISDSFTTTCQRPVLDVPHLLDETLPRVVPFLDAEGRGFLEELNRKLHRVLPGVPQEPVLFGICTGDINLRNFHIDDMQRITLFDFDQCGYGYRAFEIGKFSSAIHFHKSKPVLLQAFLDGYQQVRPLQPAELAAIPYFEMAGIIWVMGIAARNVDRIGYQFLESWWGRKLNILKTLEVQQSFEPIHHPIT